MTPEAIAKSLNTKRMTALAGARMPLPGHNRHREAELRAQLAADFQPTDFSEVMWVGDIAYNAATIEVIRAQIAGVRLGHLQAAYDHYWARESRRLAAETPWDGDFTESEWQDLHYLAERNFETDYKETALDHPAFSRLLAWISDDHLKQLQVLQAMLHDKTKERDRAINQLLRGRRQAMHDALARAEGRRREEMFRVLMEKRAANALPALPGPDHANNGAELSDHNLGEQIEDAAYQCREEGDEGPHEAQEGAC